MTPMHPDDMPPRPYGREPRPELAQTVGKLIGCAGILLVSLIILAGLVWILASIVRAIF